MQRITDKRTQAAVQVLLWREKAEKEPYNEKQIYTQGMRIIRRYNDPLITDIVAAAINDLERASGNGDIPKNGTYAVFRN